MLYSFFFYLGVKFSSKEITPLVYCINILGKMLRLNGIMQIILNVISIYHGKKKIKVYIKQPSLLVLMKLDNRLNITLEILHSFKGIPLCYCRKNFSLFRNYTPKEYCRMDYPKHGTTTNSPEICNNPNKVS